MNAPRNGRDLCRTSDVDSGAFVAFASWSKIQVGLAFPHANGQVGLGRPLGARIGTRMTHVFALTQIRGIKGAVYLIDHGLTTLASPLRVPNGS